MLRPKAQRKLDSAIRNLNTYGVMVRRRSFIAELFDFILSNKAYFIAPIIIVLLLVGGLIILGGTKAAPFIYTLF